jgi:hypothetical protein
LKRVDVPLLGVGPFLSDASQWQLTPANDVLFACSMLGTPLVVSCEAGQAVMAAFPPLLESRDDCLEKVGSRVDLFQAGFEFLEREHESDIGARAFAFHHVTGAFGGSAARAIVMVLITAEVSLALSIVLSTLWMLASLILIAGKFVFCWF